jgi:hypothetical protein
MRRIAQQSATFRRPLALGAVVLIVVGVASFLAVALFSPIMRVAEVRIIRTDTHLDIEQVQEILAPLFGRHVMLLSSYDVRSLLQAGIPDIRRVDVTKDYPSTLEVRVTLDPLIARLLVGNSDGSDVSEATASGTSVDFLTEEGIVISSPRVGDDRDLPTIVLVDWGVRPVHGMHILSPEFLRRMADAERILREQFGQDIVARNVYLRAREFHIVTPQWVVWFDARSPLEEQFQRYRTFLREVPSEEVRSYVDLRLKDRVVYR